MKELSGVCDPNKGNFGDCGEERHDIVPRIAPGYEDTGVDELGQPISESVVVQYYATEGMFEHDVKLASTPETKFAGRIGRVGEHKMWIVVRDNRGGVRWIERRFRVK